jgi:voltage-gated potassium channel Kch
MVANMIASPLARAGTTSPLSYLAFDLEHAVVLAARLAGFNILYGDGSRPDVLRAAGVKRPRAIAVCYASASQTTKACEHLHEAFPGVPLYAVAQNFAHATDLRAAGAEHICITGTEAGLNLGASVLSMFGTTETDIQLLKKGIGEAIAVRTTVCADVLKQEQQEQEAAEQQQKQQGLPSNGSSAKAALSRSSSSSSSSTSTSSSSTSSKGLPSLLPPRNGRAPMPAAASSSGSSSSGPSSGSSSKPGVEIFSLEGKWCCGEPQQGGDGSVVTPTVLTVPPSAMKAPSSSNASDAPASSSAAADSSSSSSSSSATVRARPPLAENGRNGKGIMLGVAVEEDMHGVWSMDDPAPRNGSSGSSSSGAAVGTPVAQPVQPVVAAAPVPASTQQPGSQP